MLPRRVPPVINSEMFWKRHSIRRRRSSRSSSRNSFSGFDYPPVMDSDKSFLRERRLRYLLQNGEASEEAAEARAGVADDQNGAEDSFDRPSTSRAAGSLAMPRPSASSTLRSSVVASPPDSSSRSVRQEPSIILAAAPAARASATRTAAAPSSSSATTVVVLTGEGAEDVLKMVNMLATAPRSAVVSVPSVATRPEPTAAAACRSTDQRQPLGSARNSSKVPAVVIGSDSSDNDCDDIDVPKMPPAKRCKPLPMNFNWRETLPSTSRAGGGNENEPAHSSRKRKPGRPKGSKNKTRASKSQAQAEPHDSSSVQSCHICREGSRDEMFCLTDCGHLFHTSCLDRWLSTSSQRYRTFKTCPYCGGSFRRSIPFFG